MTIICAVHDVKNKCTWIGSDSMATSGDVHVLEKERTKWLKHDGWGIASAGSARTSNLLEKNMKHIFSDKKIYDIVYRLRDMLKEDQFKEEEYKGSPINYDQLFVLANNKKIWEIGTDFYFTEIPSGRMSTIGSGYKFAMGAEYALLKKNKTMQKKDAIRLAMETACNYDIYCGGRLWVDALK